MEYLVSDADLHRMFYVLYCIQLLNNGQVSYFPGFIVDQSKEATFKVAPSKWEAVDESELQAQGETFRWQITQLYQHCLPKLLYRSMDKMIVIHVKLPLY